MATDDDDLGEDEFQIGDEEPKQKPRVPGPPVVGLPEPPAPKARRSSREDAAYQTHKNALPRECCDKMLEQFTISAHDAWHNGFWVNGTNVVLVVDGEWSCTESLLFCPFCGKRYEFGDPGNG